MPHPDGERRVPLDIWRRQVGAILVGLGHDDEGAATIADVLVAADLMGIDSHGANMLPLYERWIRAGGATARPEIRVERDHKAVVLIDGGGGFGQAPSMMAVRIAAERARDFGVAAVAIRNSNHYGAAGVYVRRLAEAGLIGISTSSVWRPAIVPTGGLEPKLGTNPIALAAPSARGRPFLLDMATSTAAIGKIRLAEQAGEPIPEGWALTPEGRPQRDPAAALREALLVPLGGYKGYGLAVAVEILSSALSGAALTPADVRGEGAYDVGHFLLALDPALVRGGGFEDDLDRMADALRATRPLDPESPVLVAGDPQYACEDDRLANGIPLTAGFAALLQELAARCGAPFLLDGEGVGH
jgi:LDH2 family malate/lactate/ureidoglycolate dehydrogenase